MKKTMVEQQEHKFSNEDALLKVLNLIFYAMVGLPLLVFLYLYLEIKDNRVAGATQDEDVHLALLILVPVISLICLSIAFLIYKKKVNMVEQAASLRQKLEVFYHASILKYLLFAAASILPIVGLYLTGEMVYTAFYLTVLLFFSLHRPTPIRLRKDMKIKSYPPSRSKEMNSKGL